MISLQLRRRQSVNGAPTNPTRDVLALSASTDSVSKIDRIKGSFWSKS